MDASPTDESITAELRKLGGNVLNAMQAFWKRPERRKAGNFVRHQVYSALRFTNREVEKFTRTVSPTPAAAEETDPTGQSQSAPKADRS
jgi:hypothetical protein